MIGRVRRQAFAAAQKAYAAASDGQDLIADMRDGFGVTVHVDEHAISAILDIMAGKATDLPVTLKIDPQVDCD